MAINEDRVNETKEGAKELQKIFSEQIALTGVQHEKVKALWNDIFVALESWKPEIKPDMSPEHPADTSLADQAEVA